MNPIRISAYFIICVSVVLGCGSAAKDSHLENGARELAPVPACVAPLPVRSERTGVLRSMSEQAYWHLVFPNFDVERHALPEDAIACTGRNVLADPRFQGGEWIRHYPLSVEEGEVVLGSGGDRLKALWLRTHRFKDGTEAGPLALVRTKETAAEVYAVGVYRGQTTRPYFGLERIGPEVVVTISDEGCTGNMKREPCSSVTSLYIPRRGELVLMTAFATERRDYVDGGEPGDRERIEYRLTSSAKYIPEGVEVSEEVTAKDFMGHELRKAELERKYVVRDTELVPREPSLWPRIFPRPTVELSTIPKLSAVATRGAYGPVGLVHDGGALPGNIVPKFSCCEDGLPTAPAPPSMPSLPEAPSLPSCPECAPPSAPSAPSLSVP